MLNRFLLALTVAGVVGGTATVESLAVFADTEVNANNTMSTSTVDISSAPNSAFLTVSNMSPGDSSIAALTISNGGTIDFRYAMTSSSTNADGKALADNLVLTVRTETVNGCAAQDGTQLYSGALSAAAFGNPAQGAQAGDRVVAAAGNEVLCFRVELPLAAGNALQNATTTATFTFDAEQVVNNP